MLNIPLKWNLGADAFGAISKCLIKTLKHYISTELNRSCSRFPKQQQKKLFTFRLCYMSRWTKLKKCDSCRFTFSSKWLNNVWQTEPKFVTQKKKKTRIVWESNNSASNSTADWNEKRHWKLINYHSWIKKQNDDEDQKKKLRIFANIGVILCDELKFNMMFENHTILSLYTSEFYRS